MAISDELVHESAYRAFFSDEKGLVITLGDLFDAVNETPEVQAQLEEILNKVDPVTVLIEGSAFVKNIDVIDSLLSSRENPGDTVIIIDISKKAIDEHQAYIQTRFPGKNYSAVLGNMNSVDLPNGSVDLVINDCAVNFNETDAENRETLTEARRVLKPGKSGILFSAVVDRTYDDESYGQNQEEVPPAETYKPGFFFPLPDHRFTRRCWPNPYYKMLFETEGMDYIEFDVEKGKTYLPAESRISYRRYYLAKEES